MIRFFSTYGKILGVLSVILFASSCEDNYQYNNFQEVQYDTKQISFDQVTKSSTCGDPLVSTLLAGKHIDAGTVTVSNDNDFVYITYETANDWMLNSIKLYAGSLANLPINKGGNPVLGHFPIKVSFSQYSTTYTTSLPIADFDECFVVAAHASVVKVVNGSVVSHEGAWGDGTRINKKGNWATYMDFCVQECDDEEENPEFEWSAWAAGNLYDANTWATYTPYFSSHNTVTLYANVSTSVGSVTFTDPRGGVMFIVIQIAENVAFKDSEFNIRIQPYSDAPTDIPVLDEFDYKATATGKTFSIAVPESNFYGVHIDVVVDSGDEDMP